MSESNEDNNLCGFHHAIGMLNEHIITLVEEHTDPKVVGNKIAADRLLELTHTLNTWQEWSLGVLMDKVQVEKEAEPF